MLMRDSYLDVFSCTYEGSVRGETAGHRKIWLCIYSLKRQTKWPVSKSFLVFTLVVVPPHKLSEVTLINATNRQSIK